MATENGLGDSCELDCNDNSPRLGFSANQDGLLKDSPPGVMCHRRTSNSSSDVNTNNEVMAALNDVGTGGCADAAITCSAEDTLNNDFFYDDEFTVPFDANISDGLVDNEYNNDSSQMIDSAEIDEIIKRGSSDGTNGRFHLREALSLSKSDSCVYQADVEVSAGSEAYDQHMSQEMTQSEKDISSSDVSESLAGGRLFTPPPAHIQPRASVTASDSDLNNSFLSAEGKFEFDWRATKDQYMISFDRNLAKYSSDESSYCEGSGPSGRVLTTWAGRGGTAWDDTELSGSCSSSKKSAESPSNNLVKEPKAACGKKLTGFSKPSDRKNQTSKPGSLKICKDNSSLTTWKAVTSPPLINSDNDFTEDNAIRMDPAKTQPRSKSLPNMKYGNKVKCLFTLFDGEDDEQQQPSHSVKTSKTSESASSDYKTCSEGGLQRRIASENSDHNEIDESHKSNSPSKRTSLLELFQKSKSQSGSDSSNTSDHFHHQTFVRRSNQLLLSPGETAVVDVDNLVGDGTVSPNSLRRLTGTWSMSTISSGRRSQCSALSPDKEAQAPPNVTLKKWGTAQNLPELSEDMGADSDHELLSDGEGDIVVSGHSVSGENAPSRSGKMYSRTCQCDAPGGLRCSEHAGSGYLSDSYSTSRLDHSAQWPPCTCNMSIQTSLDYPGGNGVVNEKYKVFDATLQTNSERGKGKLYTSRASRMYSVFSKKKKVPTATLR